MTFALFFFFVLMGDDASPPFLTLTLTLTLTLGLGLAFPAPMDWIQNQILDQCVSLIRPIQVSSHTHLRFTT